MTKAESIKLPKTKWRPASLPIYIGYDPKEQKMFDACVYSLRKNSSCDLDIYKLDRERLKTLGFYGRQEVAGNQATAFAYSRFLIPFLQNFKGFALFMDCDMLFTADVKDLFALAEDCKSISVVKHPEYTPKLSVKMDGVKQPAYPRKNWSSVMLWNCESKDNKILIPNFVDKQEGSFLHRFKWVDDASIGELPNTWNYLCDEGWDWSKAPKNCHFSNGHRELGQQKWNQEFEFSDLYDEYMQQVEKLDKPTRREMLFVREINL